MRKLAVTVAAVALVAMAAGPAQAAPNATVFTRGENTLVPNGIIQSTLRFAPGAVAVPSGGKVRWVHGDETGDPHTVTIVNESELPQNFDELDACFEGGICGQTLDRHFGADPPDTLINKGSRGLDARGDSRLFFEGESVTAMVSAPSGSQLSYLCAIHPWMQGTIFVQ